MNPSTAQARVLVDELVRCGVTDVVLAPGSRSAPLAAAVADADAQDRLTLHVRIDERSAGFLAVGLAARNRRAVAVVTTSGTAVAELLPAVTEASYGGLPLLLLTADRPPELRGIGANQTIDQPGIFGTAVRWAHDAAPAQDVPGQVAYWRSLVDRAVDTAIDDADPGPVHLNLPFRAPLLPGGTDDWCEPLGLLTPDASVEELSALLPRTVDARLTLGAAQPLDEVLAPIVDAGSVLVDLVSLADPDDEDWSDGWGDDGEEGGADDEGDGATDATGVVPSKGVVVVGHGGDPDRADAAIALAEACGWPLIGEPTGNARAGDTTLAHGALLLADPAFAADHRPEIAVVVGTVGLDRAVLAMLASTPTVVTVDPRAARRRPDPTLSTTVHLGAVPEPPEHYDAYDDSWLDGWLAADARAAAAVEKVLDAAEGLTGPEVARVVWDVLGPDDLLLAGASSPVRHLASYARVRDYADTPYVVGNRGTSGIDGLVSTAWGAALAHQSESASLVEQEDGTLDVVTTRGGAAYALIGDLAFVHDHNGLVAGGDEPRPDLVVVVVDNGGGAIFSTLETAASPHLDRVFGTPVDLDLVAVARAAGVPARLADSVTSLVEALDEAAAAGGVQVVVATVGSRAQEAALDRALRAGVAAALADAD